MKNWKRNRKNFNAMVAEDIKKSPDQWIPFFEKDSELAFEICTMEDFNTIPPEELFEKIYQKIEHNEQCNAAKKKELKKTIFDKAEKVEDQAEKKKLEELAKYFRNDEDLQDHPWALKSFWNEILKYSKIFAVLQLIIFAVLFWLWGSNLYAWIVFGILTVGIIFGLITNMNVMRQNIDKNIKRRVFFIVCQPLIILLTVLLLPSWWSLLFTFLTIIFGLLTLKCRNKELHKAAWWRWIAPILVCLIPPGAVLALSLHLDHKDMADTSCGWGWHKSESIHINFWRQKPDGEYNTLEKNLRDPSIWNPLKTDLIEEAWQKFKETDKDRPCTGTQYKAPWQGKFQAWVQKKCEQAVNKRSQQESCELVCNYMTYYRNKFKEHSVPSEIVYNNLFLPELKAHKQEKLEHICNLLEQFANDTDSRNQAREIAIIPALQDVFDNIRQKGLLEDQDEFHAKFKFLESIYKKYDGSQNNALLKNYEKLTKDRNAAISEKINLAADKFIADMVTTPWFDLKGVWLEEFSTQIPVASYVLWILGHPQVNNGEKQNDRWLKYLKNDQASNPAASYYYAAKIFSLKNDRSSAHKFYQNSLKYTAPREQRNDALHQIAVLTANKDEAWRVLEELYQNNDLKKEEFLRFARMCVERNKKKDALKIYQKCAQNELDEHDLFTLLSLNDMLQFQHDTLLSLADRFYTGMDQNKLNTEMLQKFYSHAVKFYTEASGETPLNGKELGRNVINKTYDLLKTAVMRDHRVADKLYIDIARKCKKVDHKAVEKLVLNKAVDQEIIVLAELVSDTELFLQEAKRWAQNKYPNWQKYVLKAGDIIYRRNVADAWNYWHLLDDASLDTIWQKYFETLDLQKNLDKKDLAFLVTRSIKHNDSVRLFQMANQFEQEEEYARAVYLWSIAAKESSKLSGKDNGILRYKLFNYSKPKTTLTKFSRKKIPLPFDYDAQQFMIMLKNDADARKNNLWEAALTYKNKEAALELAGYYHACYMTNPLYPKGKEKLLKKVLKEILDTEVLTQEETKLIKDCLSLTFETLI